MSGYIGIENTARKLKKMYAGIDNVARKVKKAYVGVEGKARLFFKKAELAYYGLATSPSEAVGRVGSATIGNYLLFAGGFNNTSIISKAVPTVGVYDKNLTYSSTSLATARQLVQGATTGDYALFSGGSYFATSGSPVCLSSVETYDKSLTRGSATDLTETKAQHAGTTIGNYVVFAGGTGGSTSTFRNTVDMYDSSLTHTSTTFPSASGLTHGYTIGTRVGDYAVFNVAYGGAASYGRYVSCDKSLTFSIMCSGYPARHNGGSAESVRNYALFLGGKDGDGSAVATGDTVDSSLTVRVRALSTSASELYRGSASAFGDYALFAGGNSPSTITYAYDQSLTQTLPEGLSVGRQQCTGGCIGDYVLFYCGLTPTAINTVDVYTV